MKNSKIKPGDKVKLQNSDGSGKPEYGIVLQVWYDEILGIDDCYVAFFGNESPKKNEKPKEKPYVLKYTVGSLVKL